MNKISKILVSMAGVAFAAVVAVAPVKANTLEADQAAIAAQAAAGIAQGQAYLNQIASSTAIAQAAKDAQSAQGLAQGEAYLAQIAAQAAAGLAQGQAYLNAASATMTKDQAATAAQAAAGLAQGQAYLNAAQDALTKDQAANAAQAAAGLAQGEAYLAQRAAEGKAGMIAEAKEAVRVAKANYASIADLAKVNPQFEAQLPAAQAAIDQADAFLASLQ